MRCIGQVLEIHSHLFFSVIFGDVNLLKKTYPKVGW